MSWSWIMIDLAHISEFSVVLVVHKIPFASDSSTFWMDLGILDARLMMSVLKAVLYRHNRPLLLRPNESRAKSES